MSGTRDIFRPKSEPARTLYDVFQTEAKLRKDGWQEREELAVYLVACSCAETLDMRAPTLQEVKDAASYASGHVDFAAKWVYRIVEKMKEGA